MTPVRCKHEQAGRGAATCLYVSSLLVLSPSQAHLRTGKAEAKQEQRGGFGNRRRGDGGIA